MLELVRMLLCVCEAHEHTKSKSSHTGMFIFKENIFSFVSSVWIKVFVYITSLFFHHKTQKKNEKDYRAGVAGTHIPSKFIYFFTKK